MQGTVVLLMALGGLGCHNKDCGALHAPPTHISPGGHCIASPYDHPHAPPYPVSTGCGYGSEGYPGGALRATLSSFVLGRDDVRSARDIESAFYSGHYGY